MKEILMSLPGPEVVPLAAAELAQKAAAGDFQSALALARAAAECNSHTVRQSLCRLIRDLTHVESQQVALLYLLSELAKRPALGLEVVLRELESTDWVATAPSPAAPDLGDVYSPVDLDAKSLRSLFTCSDSAARANILRRLKSSGGFDLAFGLPLNGDEWYELWPHLQADPDKLHQHLLSLPVNLAVEALRGLQGTGRFNGLPDTIPEDLDLLGWATPAPSQTVPAQTIPFERYLSDAPYHDGSDGLLETGRHRIQFNETGVKVSDGEGRTVLEVPFQKLDGGPDYQELAEYDRFFDGLASSQHVANKASSLALTPDGSRLALATLDGGVRIYDLDQGQLEREVYPTGPMAEEAIPVRLRYSGDGQWLAGVRCGHYFLCGPDWEKTLSSLKPDLRGLFFRGRALWSIFRDGAVVRLDPPTGEVYQDLPPRGVLPALSPDRRCLASFGTDQLQLFLLTDHGLAQIGQVSAPFPVRMHFADGGKTLVFRVPDPNKTGSRTALSEIAWRMGHLCLSEMGEEELAHYQTQGWMQPHPVWDFLARLAEARLAVHQAAL